MSLLSPERARPEGIASAVRISTSIDLINTATARYLETHQPTDLSRNPFVRRSQKGAFRERTQIALSDYWASRSNPDRMRQFKERWGADADIFQFTLRPLLEKHEASYQQ